MNWFRRQQNYRRPERRQVLEVRMRAGPARRSHRRVVLLALLVAAAALWLAYWGSRGWDHLRAQLLYRSRAFALNTIEVETDGWILPDQVRQWAGVKLGDNLLVVDPARIRRDLELIPHIRSASVDRVLPHLLRVRITEREPIARVQGLQPQPGGGVAPALFYLDLQAVVLPPFPERGANQEMAKALGALPVVRGISGVDLRPGQAIAQPAVHSALRLITAFAHSAMAGVAEVQAVDVASPEVLTILTRQGAEVVFGLEDPERLFRRWRAVHEAGVRQGRTIAALDLSVSNNCPVLWLEADSAPPTGPKPARTTRPSKKNV